jgi:hypothetical protein
VRLGGVRITAALLGGTCFALWCAPSAQADDPRFGSRTAPARHVRVSGEFGDRLQRTATYLVGLSQDDLLAPFRRRTDPPGSGRLLADWIAFLSDYAASRGDAALERRVGETVASVLSLQWSDGFIGPESPEAWDGVAAADLATALLIVAENTNDRKVGAAAVRLARSLGGRFPPQRAAPEQAVVGRGVLEALCRAAAYAPEDRELHRTADDIVARDPTHLLEFLTERGRLGYAAPVPAEADQSANVTAYLNGLLARHALGGGASLAPLEDAWTDIDRRHAYVTGGLPALFNWRQGAGPDVPDDAAASAEWLRFNLGLRRATGNVRYVEAAERVLFNHLRFAQRADGRFASAGDLCGQSGAPDERATGRAARALFDAVRSVCSISGRDVGVHLYVPSRVELTTDSGATLTLTQETVFPADGPVRLSVAMSRPEDLTVCLRVPGWSTTHTVLVNGAPAETTVRQGYARIARRWQTGDTIDLRLGMEFRLDRRAGLTERGQVAAGYGPLVLAIDGQFNGGLRRPFQFVAPAGQERDLFGLVPPATVGKPAGAWPISVAVAGRARSADREVIVYLTPFAACTRGPEAWWRVWFTIAEPAPAPPL